MEIMIRVELGEIRVELGEILAVFGALALFGAVYNRLIAWTEERGYIEGYTALAVVGGVLITLAGIAILSIPAAVLALGAFAASGTPMVIGSIGRHVRMRAEAIRALREELDANNPQGVAE